MKKKYGESINQAIFLGPSLVFYMIFIAIPFGLSLYYAMTKWNGVSDHMTFVGFENFKKILTQDNEFRDSLIFTGKISVIIVILTNLLAMLFALALTQSLKFRNLLRAILFLPNVLGGLLLSFIWQFIFVIGFPAIGRLTGIALFNLQWLGTENTAFWGLVIVSVWQGVGYIMVIYIAGLANVPDELIESAYMDGGTGIQVFRHITIPLMMQSITVGLFWTISVTFKMFDVNYALTKGGPYNSTQSLALNIYNEAFMNNHYGLGTAKALIFFVIIVFITLLQVGITKRKEVEV